jgi:transcriptional regulator with PAS, ATPase and Fis domain
MPPRTARTDPATADRALFAAALDELVGAVIVLDVQLRIRVATPGVTEIIGFAPPIGASAATVLCGDRPKRPFAEALASGQPFHAVIPRPGSTRREHLRVRSVPIVVGNVVHGWIVHVAAIATGNHEPILFHGMWTSDPGMKETFRVIEKVAPEDMTVLVRGETGSGKELVAQAVHALSTRSRGPFRAINCAAVPANLLESELFGHARGAFTGAVKDTPGHMQLADHGTLFLDEVAELPLELQAKLLRVIETRTVMPLGSRDAIPVDVRIVSATHRALRAEVEAGRFRADLMFRLRVIPIRLPPLRERPGDVLLLAGKIIDELNARGRRQITGIAAAAQVALERYAWPGNVRELRNVLAYAVAIGETPLIGLADLPAEIASSPVTLAAVFVEGSGEAGVTNSGGGSPEARRIRDALARTAGNRDRAAKLLGLSRVTLWRRLRDLGLED